MNMKIEMSMTKDAGGGYVITGSSGGNLTEESSGSVSIHAIINTGDDAFDRQIILAVIEKGNLLSANNSGSERKNTVAV